MLTLHIGSAVSEKTGTVNKGFSFIVMGDVTIGAVCCENIEAKVTDYLLW